MQEWKVMGYVQEVQLQEFYGEEEMLGIIQIDDWTLTFIVAGIALILIYIIVRDDK